MRKELIIVLDFGGQYNQLIARRVRDLHVYAEVIPWTTPLEEIAAMEPKGIIFTGGPNSVYLESSPHYTKDILALGVPVLGICYGAQLMAWMRGGVISHAPSGEYGRVEMAVEKPGSLLFTDIPEKSVCWMSHTDYISSVPEGFTVTASTASCPCAAMENEDFARTVGTKSCRIGDRTLVNHNQLLWRCPGAEGIKTGYTRAAGRILVSSATRCGRRLVCVSIRDPDDWNDHIRLLDEGFSRFAEVCVCPRGRVLGLLPGGVPAVCPEDVRTLLLPGERVDCVRICVSGEEATAQFMCGGTAAAACPLTAPPMGGSHGRTDPEDHCGPGGDLPPQG